MKLLLVLLAISAVYCIEGERSARGPIECHSHADCNTRELCDNGQCVERFAVESSDEKIGCKNTDDCPHMTACYQKKCIPWHFNENSQKKMDDGRSRAQGLECGDDFDDCWGGTCVNGRCQGGRKKRDDDKEEPRHFGEN